MTTFERRSDIHWRQNNKCQMMVHK